MKDVTMLTTTYKEIRNIHAGNFPDLPFGKFLMDVFYWISDIKGRNPEDINDEDMIQYFKEFADTKIASIAIRKKLGIPENKSGD